VPPGAGLRTVAHGPQCYVCVADGDIRAVRDLSLAVAPGECLGMSANPARGKSQAFLAASVCCTERRATGKAHFGFVDLLSCDRPSWTGFVAPGWDGCFRIP